MRLFQMPFALLQFKKLLLEILLKLTLSLAKADSQDILLPKLKNILEKLG